MSQTLMCHQTFTWAALQQSVSQGGLTALVTTMASLRDHLTLRQAMPRYPTSSMWWSSVMRDLLALVSVSFSSVLILKPSALPVWLPFSKDKKRNSWQVCWQYSTGEASSLKHTVLTEWRCSLTAPGYYLASIIWLIWTGVWKYVGKIQKVFCPPLK